MQKGNGENSDWQFIMEPWRDELKIYNNSVKQVKSSYCARLITGHKTSPDSLDHGDSPHFQQRSPDLVMGLLPLVGHWASAGQAERQRGREARKRNPFSPFRNGEMPVPYLKNWSCTGLNERELAVNSQNVMNHGSIGSFRRGPWSKGWICSGLVNAFFYVLTPCDFEF